MAASARERERVGHEAPAQDERTRHSWRRAFPGIPGQSLVALPPAALYPSFIHLVTSSRTCQAQTHHNLAMKNTARHVLLLLLPMLLVGGAEAMFRARRCSVAV